jgi:hypothetical protein
MPNTPAERVMWIALLLLVSGYLAGQWLNRKRTKRVGSWIQAGLGPLGGRTAWRWSKTMTAGAEVVVEEARAPYKNLIISYYLLTREFPPLWLWELLRGKRDLVSVRANLRWIPPIEFEIVPLTGKLRQKLDRAVSLDGEVAGQPYEWQELGDGLGFGMQGPSNDAACERAKEFLRTYGAHVERVSLRRRNPHVIAFFRLSGVESRPSTQLWKALGELVRN